MIRHGHVAGVVAVEVVVAVVVVGEVGAGVEETAGRRMSEGTGARVANTGVMPTMRSCTCWTIKSIAAALSDPLGMTMSARFLVLSGEGGGGAASEGGE